MMNQKPFQIELPWVRLGSTRHAVFQFLQKTLHHTSHMRKEGIAACEGLHLAHSWLKHLENPGPKISLWAVCVPERLMENSEWHGLCQLLQNAYAVGFNGDGLKKVTSTMPASACLESVLPETVLSATQFFILPDALYAKLSALQQPTGPMLILGLKQVQQNRHLDFTQDVLVLDAVQDPGNVGTLLRTALAAGITQVVCTEGTAWLWGDKALRAGMGAQFAMHVFSEAQLKDALRTHETPYKQKVPVYVTALTDGARNVFKSDLQPAGIWVFGHEGQGVSAFWLDKATHVLRIPHSHAIESLNVAASCAICLFEQSRQRGLFHQD